MLTNEQLIAQMQRVPVMENSLAIWSLGQMGVAIKGPDALVYIDPFLGDLDTDPNEPWHRAYPTPLQAKYITNADYYFITHEHGDHLDKQTAPVVAKTSPQVKFITTKWCQEILNDLDIADDRILFPTALEWVTLPGTSLKFTTIPSAHYELEYDEQKGYRWLGFLLDWNGIRFYHSGDTIIYPGYLDTLKKLTPIDIMMLPMNGRDYYREADIGAIGNFHPIEAARLANDLDVDLLIIGHNDGFTRNALPFGQIIDAVVKIDPYQKYKVLHHTELLYYVK